MQKEIIKYQGGKKHITILYKNKSKYYVAYARTGHLDIDVELDEIYRLNYTKFTFERKATVKIPLVSDKMALFYVIQVEKEEDFDIIDQVVATLLED